MLSTGMVSAIAPIDHNLLDSQFELLLNTTVPGKTLFGSGDKVNTIVERAIECSGLHRERKVQALQAHHYHNCSTCV